MMKESALVLQAIQRGDVNAIQLLIAAGIDVHGTMNLPDEFGKRAVINPLWFAFDHDQMEILKVLVSTHPQKPLVHRPDVLILNRAIALGKTELALSLIPLFRNVNEATSSGLTPLHLAARWNNLQVTTELLQYGADVNAACMYGYTPLMVAAQWGHEAIAQALLAAGADVDRVDRYGCSAVVYAREGEHDGITLALLNAGATVGVERVVDGFFLENPLARDAGSLFDGGFRNHGAHDHSVLIVMPAEVKHAELVQ